MKGHNCNVTVAEVVSAIGGPTLTVNWCMLQHLHCFIIDAVTWGLSDFACKSVQPSKEARHVWTIALPALFERCMSSVSVV